MCLLSGKHRCTHTHLHTLPAAAAWTLLPVHHGSPSILLCSACREGRQDVTSFRWGVSNVHHLAPRLSDRKFSRKWINSKQSLWL